jgi:hypothetical protein
VDRNPSQYVPALKSAETSLAPVEAGKNINNAVVKINWLIAVSALGVV